MKVVFGRYVFYTPTWDFQLDGGQQSAMILYGRQWRNINLPQPPFRSHPPSAPFSSLFPCTDHLTASGICRRIKMPFLVKWSFPSQRFKNRKYRNQSETLVPDLLLISGFRVATRNKNKIQMKTGKNNLVVLLFFLWGVCFSFPFSAC